MLLSNCTQEQWEQLRQNCLLTRADEDHINAFPYNNMLAPLNGVIPFLQQPPCCTWLIEEEHQIVGFLNYGNIIPGQPNAFGLVIGLKYARRGYAKKALKEFIDRADEYGIGPINGYCHRENAGIIRMMKSLGFVQDSSFVDSCDVNAIKFTLPR